MAVAFDDISSALSADINRQRAGSMAVAAFHELGAGLNGYLRANLRCEEDAQDLAQEVYLRITRHPNVADIQSLKRFAFTIATNLLRDKSRRCTTRLMASSISIDDIALASTSGDPLEAIEAGERLQQMRSAFASLSPPCRKAFLLSREHGMKYAAIAERMEISVSMVEKHISNALYALRLVCQSN